jgi:dTMP kinase
MPLNGLTDQKYPGRLFCVEGIDGSGKSTQIALLHEWLHDEGYAVKFSEWNSSPLVKSTTSRGKKKHLLTPTTFSLIHATDFADRTEHEIIPYLKAGAIVLCDRYAYTAFARDVARGVSPRWVRRLYRFAAAPTVAFYFRVPLDVALDRIVMGRPDLKYYEAGLDIGLSTDPLESFKLFQARIVDEYERMIDEFELTVMDATKTIEEQQRQMRSVVKKFLPRRRRLGAKTETKPEIRHEPRPENKPEQKSA